MQDHVPAPSKHSAQVAPVKGPPRTVPISEQAAFLLGEATHDGKETRGSPSPHGLADRALKLLPPVYGCTPSTTYTRSGSALSATGRHESGPACDLSLR